MIELMKDIWGFMRTRRKMWLAPVIFIMLMLGVLIVLAEGSAVVDREAAEVREPAAERDLRDRRRA